MGFVCAVRKMCICFEGKSLTIIIQIMHVEQIQLISG